MVATRKSEFYIISLPSQHVDRKAIQPTTCPTYIFLNIFIKIPKRSQFHEYNPEIRLLYNFLILKELKYNKIYLTIDIYILNEK